MNGYTRQDTSNNIANGNVVDADDLDLEFNAVEAAFNSFTGHTHDGSSGEGAPITVVGPAQDVVVSSTQVVPKANNTYDLGSSVAKWKDAYIDGTAYLDSINLNGTLITATAAELNVLDGLTATAAELNTLDGITATTAELNILDGITATTAELNILNGATLTTTELNVLDGIPSGLTSTKLGYLDVSTLGTSQASKVVTADINGDVKFSNSIIETVHTLSGTSVALDPNNGTIQTHILTGNTTYTDSFTDGESLTLLIDDGASYAVTWPMITWKTDGGVAPTLLTTGFTIVVVWKVGMTLYGARVGNA